MAITSEAVPFAGAASVFQPSVSSLSQVCKSVRGCFRVDGDCVVPLVDCAGIFPEAEGRAM